MLAPLPLLTDRPAARVSENGHWFRSGSCDQCASGPVKAECCTKVAFPITPSAGSNPDVVNFFQLHGIEVKWWGEMALAIIPQRCSALLPNGDCSLYGLPERPEVCSDGPLNAWAAQLSPACSYVFEWEGEKES